MTGKRNNAFVDVWCLEGIVSGGTSTSGVVVSTTTGDAVEIERLE